MKLYNTDEEWEGGKVYIKCSCGLGTPNTWFFDSPYLAATAAAMHAMLGEGHIVKVHNIPSPYWRMKCLICTPEEGFFHNEGLIALQEHLMNTHSITREEIQHALRDMIKHDAWYRWKTPKGLFIMEGWRGNVKHEPT